MSVTGRLVDVWCAPRSLTACMGGKYKNEEFMIVYQKSEYALRYILYLSLFLLGRYGDKAIESLFQMKRMAPKKNYPIFLSFFDIIIAIGTEYQIIIIMVLSTEFAVR